MELILSSAYSIFTSVSLHMESTSPQGQLRGPVQPRWGAVLSMAFATPHVLSLMRWQCGCSACLALDEAWGTAKRQACELH